MSKNTEIKISKDLVDQFIFEWGELKNNIPKEYTMLKGAPEVFEQCPRCKVKPFVSMLRGMVCKHQVFGLRKNYCAVICESCHEIVGYEDPKKGLLWKTIMPREKK